MSTFNIRDNQVGQQFVGDHNQFNINQTFKDCYNSMQTAPQPELQEALKTMILEVEKLNSQLDEPEKNNAISQLRMLTDEAVRPEPNKEQLALSAKGLVKAVQTCAELAPPVVSAIKNVLGLFGVVLP